MPARSLLPFRMGVGVVCFCLWNDFLNESPDFVTELRMHHLDTRNHTVQKQQNRDGGVPTSALSGVWCCRNRNVLTSLLSEGFTVCSNTSCHYQLSPGKKKQDKKKQNKITEDTFSENIVHISHSEQFCLEWLLIKKLFSLKASRWALYRQGRGSYLSLFTDILLHELF